jgi:hypothetical protein
MRALKWFMCHIAARHCICHPYKFQTADTQFELRYVAQLLSTDLRGRLATNLIHLLDVPGSHSICKTSYVKWGVCGFPQSPKANYAEEGIWMCDSGNDRKLVIASRRMWWAGYVARVGDKRNAYRLFVWKTEENRSLGRLWHRWEDNIKKRLKEIGLKGVDWIGLSQDREKWRAGTP